MTWINDSQQLRTHGRFGLAQLPSWARIRSLLELSPQPFFQLRAGVHLLWTLPLGPTLFWSLKWEGPFVSVSGLWGSLPSNLSPGVFRGSRFHLCFWSFPLCLFYFCASFVWLKLVHPPEMNTCSPLLKGFRSSSIIEHSSRLWPLWQPHLSLGSAGLTSPPSKPRLPFTTTH